MEATTPIWGYVGPAWVWGPLGPCSPILGPGLCSPIFPRLPPGLSFSLLRLPTDPARFKGLTPKSGWVGADRRRRPILSPPEADPARFDRRPQGKKCIVEGGRVAALAQPFAEAGPTTLPTSNWAAHFSKKGRTAEPKLWHKAAYS